MRFIQALGLLLLLLFSASTLASGYTTLNDRVRPLVAADKIEVTSIFSYSCPFCSQFEPLLEAWTLRQADDVEVVHLPAAFNAQWEHLARAYYLMEALDIKDQAHLALFDRIHAEGANLGSQRALRNFFASFGAEAAEVDRLYSSFGVNNELQRDRARLRAYGVTGVPALVVDGRYVITGNTAGSLAGMLDVADQVIEQVRARRP